VVPPIVTEFGPDNRITYGSWALHGARTQEEDLLQVEKRRQDLMREYNKNMSKDK
jgi:hypothetical protein